MGSGNLPLPSCTARGSSRKFAPRGLVQPGISGRRHGYSSIAASARIGERTSFRKPCARQAVHGRLNLLHLVLVMRAISRIHWFRRVDFAHDQPIRFFQGVNIFLGVRGRFRPSSKGQPCFDDAVVHVVHSCTMSNCGPLSQVIDASRLLCGRAPYKPFRKLVANFGVLP